MEINNKFLQDNPGFFETRELEWDEGFINSLDENCDTILSCYQKIKKDLKHGDKYRKLMAVGHLLTYSKFQEFEHSVRSLGFMAGLHLIRGEVSESLSEKHLNQLEAIHPAFVRPCDKKDNEESSESPLAQFLRSLASDVQRSKKDDQPQKTESETNKALREKLMKDLNITEDDLHANT